MVRAGIALMVLGFATAPAAAETNWGWREVGKPVKPSSSQIARPVSAARGDPVPAGTWAMEQPSGRAIDIARRPGVAHWQIAAAYRSAGYSLAESLDEGDHSHFAFGAPKHYNPSPQARMVSVASGEKTEWRIVYAPPSSAGGN